MDKASGTVLDFFNTVEDPRQRGKVVYRLDEILLIALAGCLAGADNFVEMAGWARLNLAALRQIRPFAGAGRGLTRSNMASTRPTPAPSKSASRAGTGRAR